MKRKILIIDDDIDLCVLLERFLTSKGYDVEYAHSGKKGLNRFRTGGIDVVICDYRLGDMDGKEVLRGIKAERADAIVLIITGYSDIKTAVDVIKAGAFDYITKPLIPDEVINVLTKSLSGSPEPVADFTIKPKEKPSITESGPNDQEFLQGRDAATQELYSQIALVAPTQYSVILYGESGTGKEVIARTIHNQSSRNKKPFVALDCGTISRELAGSELFGHMKGSFTGALADKEGLFEIASGGTLFLDEVANLSPEVQASLLRVIQERFVKRVGGNNAIPVDIRIIVASNENLQSACRKGKFREDLYHRFNEFSINLPPLRKRRADIPLFAQFFLAKTNKELQRDIDGFEPEVMEKFLQYNWPGNLREFRNVVRRAVLLTKNGMIRKEVLPWEIMYPGEIMYPDGTDPNIQTTSVIKPALAEEKPTDLKNTATKAEYDMIMQVLREVNFNKTKAAAILRIDRKTLYNKIRNFESSK